ncbi:MAG: ABC transporter substrate-binding protein [Hyphomicrobiales bacterium]|nr:ABC transporter substrate-binding protein [Hyphomicrobiales bacterium]MCP5373351.1 ABC transporter substrate-binding protein [Hyphomicrobiales bacterium]
MAVLGRRSFLRGGAAALVLGPAAIGAAPRRAAAASLETDAQAFVLSLADDAVRSLTVPNIERGMRIERFRKLFNDRFAVDAIGKWVLGRYWRDASKEQRREYLTLFEDLMVVSYVDRFAQYAGESLTVTKTLADKENYATVFSQIQRPGGQPIKVNWRVGANKDGKFKVLDVMVEGTSLGQTMRSDFASIIRRDGGGLDGLLQILREKTAALKAG